MTRHHGPVTHATRETKVMVALFVIAAFSLGMFFRDQTAGLTTEDLNPSRIRGCEDSAIGRAVALNLIASEDYPAELRESIAQLPPVCLEDDVYRGISPEVIEWLERSKASE